MSANVVSTLYECKTVCWVRDCTMILQSVQAVSCTDVGKRRWKSNVNDTILNLLTLRRSYGRLHRVRCFQSTLRFYLEYLLHHRTYDV